MVYKKGTDLEKNIKIQLIYAFIKAYLYSTIKI